MGCACDRWLCTRSFSQSRLQRKVRELRARQRLHRTSSHHERSQRTDTSGDATTTSSPPRRRCAAAFMAPRTSLRCPLSASPQHRTAESLIPFYRARFTHTPLSLTRRQPSLLSLASTHLPSVPPALPQNPLAHSPSTTRTALTPQRPSSSASSPPRSLIPPRRSCCDRSLSFHLPLPVSLPPVSASLVPDALVGFPFPLPLLDPHYSGSVRWRRR